MKKNEGKILSNRTLGKMLGVGSRSINIWYKMYETGGIDILLRSKHKISAGRRPSRLISEEDGKKLKAKLSAPNNEIKTFTELKRWFDRKFNKAIPYDTLVKYCRTNFGTKYIAFYKHKDDENAPINLRKNTPVKRREAIIYLMASDPKISMLKLSQKLNVNHKTIKRDIINLKEKKIIERVGPDKGGEWKVN